MLDLYDKCINRKYKNHLIIMDNAVIHKSKIIRETIKIAIMIYYIQSHFILKPIQLRNSFVS